MSGQAHVQSVDAIEAFRVALADFENRMQGALDNLSSELRRAGGWLDSECPQYWKVQEKKAADAVHQAKLDLERCLMFPVASEKPACREERATLKRAQDRLDYCRQKKVLVRHWQAELNHEMFEFDGRIGHLKRILETELPTARARLQLIMRRVEGYQIERAPGATSAEMPSARVSTTPPSDSNSPQESVHDSQPSAGQE